jgi:hypothetical protein
MKITVPGHLLALRSPADANAQPDPAPTTSNGPAEAVRKISAAELAPRNQTLGKKSTPYLSKHGFPDVYLNCRVPVPQVGPGPDTDEPDEVVCRHFAYAAVTRDGKMSSLMKNFSTEQGIRLEFNSTKKVAEVDAAFIKAYKEAPQGCKHLVDSHDLGRYLTALATALNVAPQKGQETPKEANCMLLTESHAMSLHVERKSKEGDVYFTVKVYDPNDTAHYKRVERSTPQDLGDLTLASLLITPEDIEQYAYGDEALSMVAVSMDHRLQPEMDRSATVASPVNMYLALEHGLRDEVVAMVQSASQAPKELFVLLQAKRWQADRDVFGIGLAEGLIAGETDTVKAYIDAVVRANLSEGEKIELLAAKDAYDELGLYRVLNRGQTDTVKAYVDAVGSANLSDLSEGAKIELLAAKNADDEPGLSMALNRGQTDTVKAYVDAVLSANLSDLSEGAKIELLAAKDADDEPCLFTALGNVETDTVKAYLDAVVSANLSEGAKIKLLAAKRADGTPCLFKALKSGDTDDIKTYVDAVGSANLSDLSEGAKIELLAAKRADGTPGLSMALQNGYTSAVKAYLDVVLESNLPADAKFKLLAAKSADGTTGLSVALHLGHTYTVKAYVDAVLTSGLPDIYKAELIPSHLKPQKAEVQHP